MTEAVAPTRAYTLDVAVSPRGSLEVLSQQEIAMLQNAGRGGVHELFRRCALAVLNTGSTVDDAAVIFDRYADFEIEIVQRTRGIKLRLTNAPASAFVDGRMIEGIKEHLFAVLRDVVYITSEVRDGEFFDLDTRSGITNAVFHVLRNAGALGTRLKPNLAVCWGGHSISREEYDYSKSVGYEMGLRGIDICTGCGPGAMKGPMKGAAVGHGKQRNRRGRYVGVSEPGIIAAEPPNPLVNNLVIMPDIEKRLEAFVRLAHAIVVFPGGVGTMEELLYLFGIITHPANAEVALPVVLTGPASAEAWFERVDALLVQVLGEDIRRCYSVRIADPRGVAQDVATGIDMVSQQRRERGDAFYFNWLLDIPLSFQQPFRPSHENMAALRLSRETPRHELAADLRRAFSGIVAGNVKDEGVRAVRAQGPFRLHGEPEVLRPVDALLERFVAEGRMKLSGDYRPCYELV